MLLLGYRVTFEAWSGDGILLFGLAALVVGALLGAFVGMMVGFRIGQRDGRRAAELHRRQHWVDLLEESVARRDARTPRDRHGPAPRRPNGAAERGLGSTAASEQ